MVPPGLFTPQAPFYITSPFIKGAYGVKRPVKRGLWCEKALSFGVGRSSHPSSPTGHEDIIDRHSARALVPPGLFTPQAPFYITSPFIKGAYGVKRPVKRGLWCEDRKSVV